MNFSRIIVADERKSGSLPPSVLLLASMQRAGIPLRVFYCGDSYLDIALLQNATEDSVTILHPKTCPNPKIMRTMFELAAAEDKINVIVCPLGKRGETSRDCSLDLGAADIASLFDCSIVLCCYAESTPNPIARIVSDITSGLKSKRPDIRVDGIVFVNPFEHRSFQIVEKNVGVNFSGVNFGYIPQELLPPSPLLEALCTPATNSKSMFLIRAASTRIAQMHFQIEFDLILAIAKYNGKWNAAEKIAPIKKTLPKIAIVDDIALRFGGNNASLLFRTFGCDVTNVSARELFSQPFDMYYFPHGLGYAALRAFNEIPDFTANLRTRYAARKFFFANGGSTQMFADKVISPDGTEQDGFGFLNGTGIYFEDSGEFGTPIKCESVSDGKLLRYGEKISGYSLPFVKLEQQAKLQQMIAHWLCVPLDGKGNTGSAGWETTESVFAGVNLDLWSYPDAARQIFHGKF